MKGLWCNGFNCHLPSELCNRCFQTSPSLSLTTISRMTGGRGGTADIGLNAAPGSSLHWPESRVSLPELTRDWFLLPFLVTWKILETTELCGGLYKVIWSHVLMLLMISYEIMNWKKNTTVFTWVSGYKTWDVCLYLDSVFENGRTFLSPGAFGSSNSGCWELSSHWRAAWDSSSWVRFLMMMKIKDWTWVGVGKVRQSFIKRN